VVGVFVAAVVFSVDVFVTLFVSTLVNITAIALFLALRLAPSEQFHRGS
jgi:hypothetical protein